MEDIIKDRTGMDFASSTRAAENRTRTKGKAISGDPATWPRGYKTFFMLNSVEHEILNAHKYKNIKKFSIFQTQISRECYFSCS